MIRVFDIETTGVDAKEDRIIEIAAYDLNPFDGSIQSLATEVGKFIDELNARVGKRRRVEARAA